MQEKNIENYNIGQTIGEGTFGKVRIGTHKLTGEKVAIKILEKDKIQDESDVNRVAKEIEILKKLRHPNIILLYEIIETDKELFLIMEYASGGELFDFIVKQHKIKESLACKFIQQILQGVEYMHKLGVVHRDLKPENLLLDSNQNIKIVDFGLSNTYQPGEYLKTACGSPCYAAPEMIQGKKYNAYMVDIWSCGIIMFAMICGYLPFEDQNTNELYKKIIAGDPHIPRHVSLDAKDLIRKILNTDPLKRYNITQIRNHPWTKQIKLDDVQGIVVGLDSIVVDENIVEQLKHLYSIEPSNTRKYVSKNRHNQITTLYYLQIIKNKNNKIQFKNYMPNKLITEGTQDKSESTEKYDKNKQQLPQEIKTPKRIVNVVKSQAPALPIAAVANIVSKPQPTVQSIQNNQTTHSTIQERESIQHQQEKILKLQAQQQQITQQAQNKYQEQLQQHNARQRAQASQHESRKQSESPKPSIVFYLKREEVKRQAPKANPLPKTTLKPIANAVNNSISSAGTNQSTSPTPKIITQLGNTPLITNRKREESASLEKIGPQKLTVRVKAISVQETYSRPVLKVHKGPFNLKCTSDRQPDALIEDIKVHLDRFNIKYTSKNKYEVLCQINNTKFELSIRTLQNNDMIYLIKSHCISSDKHICQQYISRIINNIQI